MPISHPGTLGVDLRNPERYFLRPRYACCSNPWSEEGDDFELNLVLRCKNCSALV